MSWKDLSILNLSNIFERRVLKYFKYFFKFKNSMNFDANGIAESVVWQEFIKKYIFFKCIGRKILRKKSK